MYTRCPSCRAEISFEPPRNLANLPQGYKHRIRCPNCGVTIGVKIPNTAVVASPAPTYSYENPNQQGYSEIEVGVGTPQTGAEQKAVEKSAKNAKKKSYGRGKAATLFIFSLLFIAAAAIAYLHNTGTNIPVVGDYIASFNPIGFFKQIITDFSGFIDGLKSYFQENILYGIGMTVCSVSQAIIFVFAGLMAITNLLVLIVGKYNGAAKAFNVIFAIFSFVFAIADIVFAYLIATKVSQPGISILDFLKEIIEAEAYIVFAIIGLTFIVFLLACIFTGKTKREKQIKGIVDEEE